MSDFMFDVILEGRQSTRFSQIPTPKTKVGKLNQQLGICTEETYRKSNEQLFPNK